MMMMIQGTLTGNPDSMMRMRATFPVPALPSLDEIQLNPDHNFEMDLHLLVSFIFLRIQSEFGNYILLYIFWSFN